MTTPPTPDDAGALLQAIQEQIAAVLQGMREDLAALAGRLTTVEQRLAVPDAERVPGMPVVWGRLEATEYDELWPRFVDWVTWLADTYELTPDQLPRCWHHHGGVVAELTGLWTGYEAAHHPARGGTGSSPYQWGDALGRALDRIRRTWLGDCTTGVHTTKTRPSWANDTAYQDELQQVQQPSSSP